MFKNNNDIIEFDEIIRQEWGSPIIKDGIIDIEKFLTAKPKILWVLKEGNEKSPNKDRDHREFHENVTVYPKWSITYENVIKSTYGLLYDCRFSDLPRLDNNDAKINVENVLLKVALINVNKNGGVGTADRTNIELNYSLHRKVLLTQIKEINPDVIINCSRVFRLFNDVSSEKFYDLEKDNLNKINFSYNNDKLFIDYYHPGCRKSTKTTEQYCSDIINIYQNWLKIKEKN